MAAIGITVGCYQGYKECFLSVELNTGFSKSVSNVNFVIDRVQDVNPYQSDISFPSS